MFFAHATAHLQEVIKKIQTYKKQKMVHNARLREELPKVNEDDKLVQQRLLEYGEARVLELEALEPSPYFVQCHVTFKNGKQEVLQFGKFSFSEEGIYSWITPASAMRFQAPGLVTYTRPDGELVKGVLDRKDQYLITEGKIVFLASESLETKRELIYQEYFSRKKHAFVLPEIVAQMEEAQDAVIRADPKGGLLISGPAGSGKTTLALHRVAYLAQSPDVAEDFTPSSMLVFVQDESTKDYFSHLLPELGIYGVTITTFHAWAKSVLEIEDVVYTERLGSSESDSDQYEFAKRKALAAVSTVSYTGQPYSILEKVYTPFFTEEQLGVFKQQKKLLHMDRFDMTVLLLIFLNRHGSLSTMQEYYQMNKNGAATRKRGRFPVEYSLIIFDEFQNYLSEQIALAKTALSKKNNAVMYVGDMAQQTKLGTIRTWEEIGEIVPDDRRVLLKKVYRNTKEIIQYIQSLGYDLSEPKELKSGVAVQEKTVGSDTEACRYIDSVLAAEEYDTYAILAKTQSQLMAYKEYYAEEPQVHCMMMHEAQGLEFDVVFLVGIEKNMFSIDERYDTVLKEEKRRIHQDTLYVALTRAIEALHVLGTCPLQEVLGE